MLLLLLLLLLLEEVHPSVIITLDTSEAAKLALARGEFMRADGLALDRLLQYTAPEVLKSESPMSIRSNTGSVGVLPVIPLMRESVQRGRRLRSHADTDARENRGSAVVCRWA